MKPKTVAPKAQKKQQKPQPKAKPTTVKAKPTVTAKPTVKVKPTVTAKSASQPTPTPKPKPAAVGTVSCPCGSGKPFEACCGPYLAGTQPAPTAQALMRSRFTAFARGDIDYVLRSWHPRARPPSVDLTAAGAIVWDRLEIVACHAGGRTAKEGKVEFIAHCTIDGRPEHLHEVSRFVREDGKWYYVDGEIKQARINKGGTD